ncbi:MAG: tRNA pseudouridine(55) synthase TruB, partial [Actinobacteria bacterium]
ATRLSRYLVGLDKHYLTEIRLGIRTSTGDGEGDVVEDTPMPSVAEIKALEGEVELPVPRASAVKIEGERAYRLHRRGIAVEMPVRRSTVHRLEILRFEPPLLELDLRVSSGTYIRSLADALGGHCRTLRRTAVGPFRIEDADEALVLPPLAAVVMYPAHELSDAEARLIRTGRPLPGRAEGPVALYSGDTLIAVGTGDGTTIQPETVLP